MRASAPVPAASRKNRDGTTEGMDKSTDELLRDIRELEPTTNGELQEQWGLDSGSDVADVLRNDLDGHTYRDDDYKIRANNDAPAPDHPDTDVNPGGGNDDAVAVEGDAVDTVADDVDTPPEEEQTRATDGAEGQQDGVTSVAHDSTDEQDDPLSVDAAHTSVGADTVSPSPGENATFGFKHPCPECGGSLDTDVAGHGFIRHDGETGELGPTDAVCHSCDLVVPDQGDVIYGSEYNGGASNRATGGGGGGWFALTIGMLVAVVAVVFGTVGRDDCDEFKMFGNDSGSGVRSGRF